MVVVIVLALRANARTPGGAGHEPGLAIAAAIAAAVFATLGVVDYVLIVVAAIFVWMTLWLSRARAITLVATGIVVACAIAAPVASAVLENRAENPDPPTGELFARGLKECKPAASSVGTGGTDRPYTQLGFSDEVQESYGPLRCADLTAELRDPAGYDRCVREKQGEYALGLDTDEVQECIDRSGLKP
jgi:hypothetical protein